MILFGAFVVLAYTGLFSVIDARFYEPEKIEQIQNHLDIVSENYNEYIQTLEKRFGIGEHSFLNQKSVLSYIENSPSDENVKTRSKLSGDLFSETPGLLGMRLIDKDGISIHYSTFSTDILNRTKEVVSYKNYSEVVTLSGEVELEFEKISSPDSYSTKGKVCKTVFDGKDNRIIFSYPFYDSYSAYRGSFIFYVNANDFNRVLIAKKIITFGETGNLVSGLNVQTSSSIENKTDYKSGFVFGIPRVGKELFEKEILSRWEKGLLSPEKIVFKENQNSFDSDEKTFSLLENKNKESYWVLVSSTKTQFGYIGGIYSDDIFVMSDGIKILLLICIFVTLFLVTFLLVNLKQDEMIVIRDRIRKLQLGIISEYLKNKEDVNWKVVSGKISERRQDVSLEILRSLGRKGKKHSKEVNELINRCWDELLAAMNFQSRNMDNENVISNSEQIKNMLQEILSSGSIKVQSVNVESSDEKNIKPSKVEKINSQVTVEEVSELDEVEELSELDEVSELNEDEELSELDEVSELDEAEELSELDEVSELDQAEELSELDEVSELDEDEELSGLEEVSELDEAEELSGLDEVSELDEVEELSDAEVSDIGEFEEVEDFLSDKTDEVDHKTIVEAETISDVERINKEVSSVHHILTEEDNFIIDNFSIENPDFSDLDEDGLQEKSSTKDEVIEEVSLNDFDISFDDNKIDELEEKVGFASFENTNNKVVETNIEFNVEPEPLNFSILDKKVELKRPKIKKQKLLEKDSEYSIKKIQEEVQSASLVGEQEILELVDSSVEIPFSLTTFGAISEEPVELQEFVEVIQEDESGVYSINQDALEPAPQDLSFKDLVDSVLNKN